MLMMLKGFLLWDLHSIQLEVLLPALLVSCRFKKKNQTI